MENLYEKFIQFLEDHPEADEMFYPWNECSPIIIDMSEIYEEVKNDKD